MASRCGVTQATRKTEHWLLDYSMGRGGAQGAVCSLWRRTSSGRVPMAGRHADHQWSRLAKAGRGKTLPARIGMSPSKGWSGLPLFSSVRGRAIATVVVLVVILVVVVGASTSLAEVYRSDLAASEQRTRSLSLLQDARVYADYGLVWIYQYIMSRDESLLPEARSYLARSGATMAEVRAIEEAQGDREQLASIDELLGQARSLLPTFEQLIALGQSGDVEGATATLVAARPQIDEMRFELDRLVEAELQEMQILRDRAHRAGDLAFWELVGLGLTGAVLALAVSAAVARSVLEPLAALESTALAVAGGDLGARAPAGGPRELARLGAAVNQMTESLLDASKRRHLEAEREQALVQLRESEHRCCSLIENALDIITVVEADGTSDWWRRL